MRTSVYIDGFNFYYGAVRGTPYKWLDFRALLRRILKPKHEIVSIRYFTALVSATSDDPDKPNRQQTYIRALEAHLPVIEVHYGFFLRSVKKGALAHPTADRRTDDFIRTEEKGSDVNLAVHLLRDAWRGRYECAVIVSNDSDLAEAMRVVKTDFGKVIGLITPTGKSSSKELTAHADFVRRVRRNALAQSQLPNPIPGTSIHKPLLW